MVDKIKHHMGRAEWGMLFILAFLVSLAFITSKIALIEIPPFALTFMRTSIASLALIAWCLIRKKNMKLPFKQHVPVMIIGTMFAFAFSFFTWGLQYTSTSIASVLLGTLPFFVAIFAHFLLGKTERLTPNKIIGLLIGLVGVITIIGFNTIADFNLTNIGQLAIIISCLFRAMNGISIRLYVQNHLDKTVVATYTLIWASVPLGIVSLFLEGTPSFDYSANIWVSVSALALLSTAVTGVMVFRLIKRIGASNTSLTTFIIPIFAIGIGVIFLGESLKTNEIIGIFLILIGVGFIQNLHKKFARV